jgi:hypothetical protein
MVGTLHRYGSSGGASARRAVERLLPASRRSTIVAASAANRVRSQEPAFAASGALPPDPAARLVRSPSPPQWLPLLTPGPAPLRADAAVPRRDIRERRPVHAHGPVAIRVVRGLRPVGLYRMRIRLSNETVLGRETVSSMQRRPGSGDDGGVNGDLSRFADGKPSGIFPARRCSDRTLRTASAECGLRARRNACAAGQVLGHVRGFRQRRSLNVF